MSSLILHHYALSPYSEKIRLMCGYAGVPWRGVISPAMPPRPDLDPLVGGYRRMPVAQIGADLFCDTHLISAEIAALSNLPALDPAHCDEAALGLSAGLETDVFWACVAGIPPGRTLRQLLRKLGLVGAVRFIVDRAGVARAAVSKPMAHREAVSVFARHLGELNRHLDGGGTAQGGPVPGGPVPGGPVPGGPFLFGEVPSHADFAAYHTFWFQVAVGELPRPEGIPAFDAWYARMGAFGHGSCEEVSGEVAFAAARESEPRALQESLLADHRIGQTVTVRPADYALDGTTGVLAGADERRWIIARDTVYGRVHVHFPTEGFALEVR